MMWCTWNKEGLHLHWLLALNFLLYFFYAFSLGCGTTWHSAGLLGAIRGSRAHTKLTRYSNELYSELDKSGHGTGTFLLCTYPISM